MKPRQALKQMEQVIAKVLPLVPKTETTKKEFEAILDRIIVCVHENTKVSKEDIGQKTNKIITDLPEEYGRLPEEARSWEALIAYLYSKYLKELGKL
jgi:hypothetical protein